MHILQNETVSFYIGKTITQLISNYNWSEISTDLWVKVSCGIATQEMFCDNETIQSFLLRAISGLKIAKKENGNCTRVGVRSRDNKKYSSEFVLEEIVSDLEYGYYNYEYEDEKIKASLISRLNNMIEEIHNRSKLFYLMD